jgi:hypothetical protein
LSGIHINSLGFSAQKMGFKRLSLIIPPLKHLSPSVLGQDGVRYTFTPNVDGCRARQPSTQQEEKNKRMPESILKSEWMKIRHLYRFCGQI